MTFARLTRGDWVAAVAALALLLVMSLDWYSTESSEQAVRDAESADTRGPLSGEPGRQAREDAEIIRNRHEKTAWQAGAFADRLILFLMLAAIGMAIAAAWLRAAGRRFNPPWTPSALATGAGMAALILLAARILQKPSVEAGAVVKAGAPIGVICVGALAIGARFAWNAERDGSAWAGQPAAGDAGDDGERTAERDAVRRPAPLFDHEEPAEAAPAGATATIAPPAPAGEAAVDADEADEPADDPAAPPDDEPFAGPDIDPAAAERERRRAERNQRRGGGKKSGRRRRRR